MPREEIVRGGASGELRRHHRRRTVRRVADGDASCSEGGYRVLLLDRATFASDTISTHVIHQPGVRRLQKWGLLGDVVDSNCPPIRRITLEIAGLEVTGQPPGAEGVRLLDRRGVGIFPTNDGLTCAYVAWPIGEFDERRWHLLTGGCDDRRPARARYHFPCTHPFAATFACAFTFAFLPILTAGESSTSSLSPAFFRDPDAGSPSKTTGPN